MHQFNFLFSPAAEALGHALLFSIGQAFVIFLCLRLLLKFIPNVSSHVKYSLAYGAYLAIGAWFFATLIRQYSVAQSEAVIQQFIGENSFNPIGFDTASIGSSFFSMSFLNEYLPLLVALYMVGIFCYSIRLSINFFQIGCLKTKGLYEMDAEWQHHIMSLASRMDIRRPLLTYFSAKVKTPMMIGFLKPVILLPFTAMNHLSAEQFEAIVLHELAHIRRNDYLMNLIQSVLDTVLFFNPFTWWLTQYIREEREKSCDEMVLQFSDPYPYARALLSLEEPLSKKPLIMTAVGKRSHLFHRIKNIMEMKNNHLNLRQKLIAFLVIAMAIISVSWLSPSENKAHNSENQKSINQETSTISTVSFFTFLPFNLLDSTPGEIAPLPPAPPLSPATPMAMAHEGVPPLPPAPPVAPVPPAAPLPPNPLYEMNDTIPPSSSYFNSKEWKKQEEAIKKSTEEMRKYFQSDAWKKQQNLMKENSLAMKKYFNSPEWKKQQHLIKKNAVEIQKHFNSPEWKKQVEQMKKSGEEMKKYFDSPEWKKQQELMKKNGEEMKKYFSSPEWKKQQEMFKKNAEKMKDYFNSPEWKKQQEELSHATDSSLSAFFKSDAWEKQQENIQKAVAKTQDFFKSEVWKNVQQNLQQLQTEQQKYQDGADLKKK